MSKNLKYYVIFRNIKSNVKIIIKTRLELEICSHPDTVETKKIEPGWLKSGDRLLEGRLPASNPRNSDQFVSDRSPLNLLSVKIIIFHNPPPPTMDGKGVPPPSRCC